MSKLTRRDFLKLIAGFSTGAALSGWYPSWASWPTQTSDKPNIIVLVLDAMSARNLSMYGYSRLTDSNISQLAERATVYHYHYAAGNFTTPGTASILTGTYPWTHRALNMRGTIKRGLADKDLFALAGPEYYRMAFTQNMFTDVFLRQSRANLEMYLPLTAFRLNALPPLLSDKFPADPLLSYYAFDNSVLSHASVSTMLLNYWNVSTWKDLKQYSLPSDDYPYGTPFNTYNYYHNDAVFDGVKQAILGLAQQPNPFLAYIHLYSPHAPYAPRKEFVGIFQDMDVTNKPRHALSISHHKKKVLMEFRKEYDEFITNVDSEFGKLIDALEQAGVLNNTYLFLLSDHGELFERGEHGHLTPLMYDSILHIPLIVYAPHQQGRRDVFSPTSNVDILPTVLKILGEDLPTSLEGKVLPGFGGEEDFERSVFSLEAKLSPALLPLNSNTSLALIKGRKKLIYYLGYPDYENSFELYDLEADADEMNNLFLVDKVNASRMKEELLGALEASNQSLAQG